ncbi:signal peptidase I [Leucobacter allii]|uniref:signal peptidase I n=1 Tax=Leucobacter allii TaxID=2932247 RepID=UPI001FD03F8B|nr:signal peptidase I [Leucobacter allii]UOR01075.1 signal peptidase I [Leucobacter allii]
MTQRRRGGRAIGNALLNLAALGGVVCIVLVILSVVFHISLIMFKTGSMSPTIPAGSVAIVREIPATEIEVGDVVTVDRAGALPVTHRVTSVSGSGETRIVTMRGDANEAEDPTPYTVSEVRRVLFAVPELARVVVWFSNPWVLGALTIGASILVTWAFWPRGPRGPRPDAGVAAGGARRSADGGGAGADATASDPRHGGRPAARTLLLALLLGTGAPAVAPAPPAEASPVMREPAAAEEIQVVHGDVLVLTSIGDPAAMARMDPGEPARWQVGVRAEAPEPGAVDVSLEASGTDRLGLSADVRGCSARWIADACPGIETALAPPGLVDVTGASVPLASIRDTEELWVLVTATATARAPGSVALTIRAAGAGDDIAVGPGGPIGTIPITGGPDLIPALWLGIGAVAAGLAAAGLARAARALPRGGKAVVP